MKKLNLLMKLVMLLVVCSMLTACGGSKVTTTKKEDSDTKVEATKAPEDADVKDADAEDADAEDANADQNYGLGDLITVSADGEEKYLLSIDSVTTTDERNEYADTNPEQVVIINYTYWNVGNEEDIYIGDYDFKVIDGSKNVCSTYPGTIDDYPSNTPIGTKCSAQICYGLDAKSENIELHFTDSICSSPSDFIISVPTEGSSDDKHEDAASFQVPAECYKVGDTISVNGDDGEYNITINSAKKQDERNEYAGEVGAVWVLDYTYENVSCANDLYISDIQCVVVDGNGQVGSSYPGNYSKYPDDTPKGAKCTAEMCFGTKADTDTIYLYFYDNMFSGKADMVFEITEK